MAYFIRHNKKGFSLAELGIAMVILLVIATIATISYFAIIDNAKEVKVVEEAKTVQLALIKEDIREFSTEADFNDLDSKVQDILKYHFDKGTNLTGMVFKDEAILKDGKYILGNIRTSAADVGGVSFNTLGDLLFKNLKVNAASEDEIKVRKLESNKMNKLIQDNLSGDWYVVSNAVGTINETPQVPDDSGSTSLKSCDELTLEGYICISTPEELDNMRADLTANYALVSDVNLSSWGDWIPVGDSETNFTGNFDGNGHVIENMTVNASSGDVGLFGLVRNTEIKNTVLVNPTVINSGDGSTGSLVGVMADSSVVKNSGVDGGSVKNTGTNTGKAPIGGLIGKSGASSTVSDSYSSTDVIGYDLVGGLIGIGSGIIKDSYATGDVTGNTDVGGFAGYNNNGTMSNIYATGNVTGNDRVGGIVGVVYHNISDAYALNSGVIGNTTNVDKAINLHRLSRGEVNSLSVLSTITGTNKNIHASRIITPEEAVQQVTYSTFDFDTIWVIEEGVGYPTLQWQNK